MLDIQLLRKDAALVAERLAARGFQFDTKRFEELEAKRKRIQIRKDQELKAEKNRISKMIGQLRASGHGADDPEVGDLMKQSLSLSLKEKALEEEWLILQAKLNYFLMGVPNLPHESVAVGKDETANVEVSRWGTPKNFDFPVRDHVDLGEGLGQLDFAAAVESLPAHYLEVILLRDFEELTIAEIAGRLHEPAGAIKSRLHRARALVREYLSHEAATP